MLDSILLKILFEIEGFKSETVQILPYTCMHSIVMGIIS